ncbi:MAG: hypothetical protein ACLTVE_00775 [Clostridia bacterium]
MPDETLKFVKVGCSVTWCCGGINGMYSMKIRTAFGLGRINLTARDALFISH